jgi:RHS repeat-associated protein
LGSTSLLFNGDGGIVGQYEYLPFGELSQGGGGNPFTFTGREDDQTGLMYYRARYYAPTWGRFISEDPIGFSGGVNQYSYAGNNPTTFTDPWGLVEVTMYFRHVFGGGWHIDILVSGKNAEGEEEFWMYYGDRGDDGYLIAERKQFASLTDFLRSADYHTPLTILKNDDPIESYRTSFDWVKDLINNAGIRYHPTPGATFGDDANSGSAARAFIELGLGMVDKWSMGRIRRETYSKGVGAIVTPGFNVVIRHKLLKLEDAVFRYLFGF